MILVGIVILGAGLFLRAFTLQAVRSGRQYAGYIYGRPTWNRLGADTSAVISLFVVIAGAICIYAGICEAFPSIERRRWFRWITGLIIGPLILLLLASGALVVAVSIFRL